MKRILHIVTKILDASNVLKMVKSIGHWPRMCILAICISRLSALHGKVIDLDVYMGSYPHIVTFGLRS